MGIVYRQRRFLSKKAHMENHVRLCTGSLYHHVVKITIPDHDQISFDRIWNSPLGYGILGNRTKKGDLT